MNDFDNILQEFNHNQEASNEAINNAEKTLKTELPRDYTAFLRRSNGGEGMIGENYVILWKAEELAEMNEAYQVGQYAPGLLLIGSDGGGEAFAFDTRTAAFTVVKVPFVGMDLQYAELISTTFDGFLRALAG